MDLKSVIQKAFDYVAALPDTGRLQQEIHRNRSKSFVEALAESLRSEFGEQETIRVLSKHNSDHRTDFGLNELLFDVLVCDTAETKSARGAATLRYVTRAIWAIESEMAKDTREAIYDFNKLVIARSDNKLFIGPQSAEEEKYLAALAEPAACCLAPVYVALVPHPEIWKSDPGRVRLWRFTENRWENM